MKYCSSCGQCLSDNCDICPICGHDASDAEKEQKNPYEAEKYVRSGVKYSYVKPRVTLTLIAVNVVIFLVISLLNLRGSDFTALLSMHRGAVASGQIYRVITSIFTHEDLFHLLSNCYALYIYGMMLEPAVGKIKFLLIYFSGGLLGNLLTFAFMRNPSIGASGAIFGLLGAVIAIYYINPTAMNRMMMKNVLFCVMLTTLYSFTGGINNIAHFGGMFGGYMMTCVCIGVRHRKRIITSRSLMAIILVVALVGSVFYGIPKIEGANELQYGNYVNMRFFASFGNYDIAKKYAEEIAAEGESIYLMDAVLAEAVYGLKKGDKAFVQEKLYEIMALNQKGYAVIDENIYDEFSRLIAFVETEGIAG
ncbi:MAG: rhomboid family intramembrane serine protease [Clostridia bacterium]|nr:rhomboid family intramembrane serine protease [Clostridia bacterium]